MASNVPHLSSSGTDSPPSGYGDLADEKGTIETHRVVSVAADGKVAMNSHGETLARFDAAAEARLRRKIDLYIVPTVALIYLFCFIDRANIGNARLAGIEKDLKLRGYDYNTLLSIFYVSYIVFEIPSNMACKVFGPGKWLPFLTFCFGILTICFSFVRSFGSALAVRFLLGAAEAGMLPGIAYYLSRWYRKDELAFRLALYIVMAPLAGAFGGLLASGILKIDRIGSLERWMNIFLIEGIITVGLGIIAFFTLTDRIETARWLTDEEKALATARVKSENAMTTTVLDQMRFKAIWSGISNPTTMVCTLAFLFDNISVQGIAFFTPTIIRTLFPGRTVVQQQLYTVPPYIVGACFVLAVPWVSMRTRTRAIPVIFCATLMVVGYAMFLGSSAKGVRYAASFVGAAGAFCLGALLPSWASANVVSDSERNGAIGAVVMGGNLGGLISTWSYLPSHAPNFVPGNSLNVATSAGIILLVLALVPVLKRENAKRENGERDYLIEGRSPEEQQVLGHKHPAHRYRY